MIVYIDNIKFDNLPKDVVKIVYDSNIPSYDQLITASLSTTTSSHAN